ncbi:nucleotide exchange factor GrpE [Frankia sp. CiP3]|uniref:nucleotide exchange factor GrpE n=1 Tax=Frankia sp. CiP3 TaxID=2880971 RepID=UPI001EF553B4|nr:nucleotide exchange factor GrpE [Frankia sp. CiP3]
MFRPRQEPVADAPPWYPLEPPSSGSGHSSMDEAGSAREDSVAAEDAAAVAGDVLKEDTPGARPPADGVQGSADGVHGSMDGDVAVDVSRRAGPAGLTVPAEARPPAGTDEPDEPDATGDPAGRRPSGAGAVPVALEPAEPEPAQLEPAALECSDPDSGEAHAGPVADIDLSMLPASVADLAGLTAVSAAATVRLDELHQRVEELARLRRHDADLVDRLHAENTRLRAGELAEAMAPLLRGLMRLHDQMTSLGADDGQSVAGILRKQLLQVMDLAADVRPYTAVVGMPFDPARHTGMRRVGVDDPSRDRTIARTLKPGFVRGESTVVRPAEVEVFRAH